MKTIDLKPSAEWNSAYLTQVYLSRIGITYPLIYDKCSHHKKRWSLMTSLATSRVGKCFGIASVRKAGVFI